MKWLEGPASTHEYKSSQARCFDRKLRRHWHGDAGDGAGARGELAVINGRSAQNVSDSDWEQAKRELTGEPDMDPKELLLEAAPESERWDPVPGSTGHKGRVAPSEDEDEDGRSDNERLVEEGIEAAEHDQMRQAARNVKA